MENIVSFWLFGAREGEEEVTEKEGGTHLSVIVSAGAAGATLKISFVGDEHQRRLETKGTARYEKLIICCVLVIMLLCNRRATHTLPE